MSNTLKSVREGSAGFVDQKAYKRTMKQASANASLRSKKSPYAKENRKRTLRYTGAGGAAGGVVGTGIGAAMGGRRGALVGGLVGAGTGAGYGFDAGTEMNQGKGFVRALDSAKKKGDVRDVEIGERSTALRRVIKPVAKSDNGSYSAARRELKRSGRRHGQAAGVGVGIGAAGAVSSAGFMDRALSAGSNTARGIKNMSRYKKARAAGLAGGALALGSIVSADHQGRKIARKHGLPTRHHANMSNRELTQLKELNKRFFPKGSKNAVALIKPKKTTGFTRSAERVSGGKFGDQTGFRGIGDKPKSFNRIYYATLGGAGVGGVAGHNVGLRQERKGAVKKNRTVYRITDMSSRGERAIRGARRAMNNYGSTAIAAGAGGSAGYVIGRAGVDAERAARDRAAARRALKVKKADSMSAFGIEH